MDGTFKATPELFAQLYTIHAVCRDFSFPVVYCLLPNKTRATYHRVFAILKAELADFESGITTYFNFKLNAS